MLFLSSLSNIYTLQVCKFTSFWRRDNVSISSRLYSRCLHLSVIHSLALAISPHRLIVLRRGIMWRRGNIMAAMQNS
jgi:hypothetical protein